MMFDGETVQTTDDAGITRYRIFLQADGLPVPGGPILSQATVHRDTVYLCGVITPELWRDPSGRTVGDVRTQTRAVLERVDQLLDDAGTHRSKLLTAQIWLADMADFAVHNEEWNAWVDPRRPPARACVQAGLAHPALKVEVMATAAR